MILMWVLKLFPSANLNSNSPRLPVPLKSQNVNLTPYLCSRNTTEKRRRSQTWTLDMILLLQALTLNTQNASRALRTRLDLIGLSKSFVFFQIWTHLRPDFERLDPNIKHAFIYCLWPAKPPAMIVKVGQKDDLISRLQALLLSNNAESAASSRHTRVLAAC